MKLIVKRLLDPTIISLITLLLVEFTIVLPLSFAKFNVAQNIFEQYNVIDAYFTIHKQNEQVQDIANIVVVDIANCTDRDSISDYIKTINSAEPKVIGIDILFENPDSCTDSRLIQVLTETPNLVVVSYLKKEYSSEECRFYEQKQSFDTLQSPLYSGCSNHVYEKGLTPTCRYFLQYMFLNEDTIKTFASTIARIALPKDYAKLTQRKYGKEYINFNNFIDTINIQSFQSLSYEDKLSWIKDKIVLIGNLNNLQDRHITPIQSQMSGIMLHAYILSTIEKNNFINIMSDLGNWIMSFLIIMIVASIKHRVKNKEWLNMFMPVIQGIIILIGIILGYLIFDLYNYYIPVIYILIGVGIVSFPYNLYYKIKENIFKHKKIKQ